MATISGNTFANTGNITSSSISVSAEYNTPSDAFFQLINRSNIMLLVWFLAIYFVVYFVVQLVSGGKSGSVVGIFDLIFLGIVLFYVISVVVQKSEAERKQMASDTWVQTKDYVNHPITLFSVGLFIFLFYAMIYLVGIPMSAEDKPISVMVIENCAWIFLLLIVVVSFFRYALNVSLTDIVDRFINSLPQDSNAAAPVRSSGNVSLSGAREVFNIKNNMYTYNDAQGICASYGARLATYQEVEDTYNNGGEWCNYGWSDGQLALFPTQSATWSELQKHPDKKNACGRPGVNGGFIDNPKVRFGVNCFGNRPKAKNSDLASLAAGANSMAAIPKSEEDQIMDLKIAFWKKNSDKLLQVNSFNNTKWGEY